MFDLADWKQTQFYKDVKLEGKLEGKLEIVRQLLQRGMTLAEVVSLTGLSEQELQQELSTEIKMNGQLMAENQQHSVGAQALQPKLCQAPRYRRVTRSLINNLMTL